jgi:hypothetical protein
MLTPVQLDSMLPAGGEIYPIESALPLCAAWAAKIAVLAMQFDPASPKALSESEAADTKEVWTRGRHTIMASPLIAMHLDALTDWHGPGGLLFHRRHGTTSEISRWVLVGSSLGNLVTHTSEHFVLQSPLCLGACIVIYCEVIRVPQALACAPGNYEHPWRNTMTRGAIFQIH